MAAHSRCCWLGGKRAASAGKLSSLCSVAGKVSTPVSRDVDVYYLICVAVVFSFTEKIMEGSTGDRDQHIDNSPQDRASTSSSSGHKASAKSSRAPQKNPQNLTNMPDKKYCWACGEKTMPGKLVCIDCFYCFPMEEENQQQDLPTLIKEIVQQSLEERTAASLPDNRSIGGGASITDTLPSLEEVEVEEEFSIGFDFALVDPFIRSVREAIQWEEPQELQAKKMKYYPHLKKKVVSFPIMEEVSELVKDEWSRIEKKPAMGNRLSKLYPIQGELAAQLDGPPLVDASVMRLARHVTLPIEDSVAFKDSLDRRMDQDLKKAYLSTGGACKPAIALTSIAKAIKVWADNLEGAIQANADKHTLIAGLEEFRIASDFIGEASFDILRCATRGMLYDVTAKRAMWLKPWSADSNSKAAWCRIPFDGKNLFGSKMDTAIARVTGGRSGLLPQDRRPNRRQTDKRPFQSKSKNYRAQRGNQGFRRQWQGAQSNLSKYNKQRNSTSTQNAKSF